MYHLFWMGKNVDEVENAKKTEKAKDKKEEEVPDFLKDEDINLDEDKTEN